MVLGSGMVARGFNEFIGDDRYLVFASGVSNSATHDSNAFVREKTLLNKSISEHRDKTFVYFSTCSVYDPSQRSMPYVQHKLAMEAMLEEMHHQYHIFRISNLAGKTDNPHTVLNFLAQHIRSGEFFFAWKHASRNIIDLDDAVKVCGHIIKEGLFKNEILNIANITNNPVPEIIGDLEVVLGKKGNYDLIDKGSNPEINTSLVREIYDLLKIGFDQGYLTRTLKKYYGRNDL
jgi:nucleoside-diphosphate-sugar epimerase